MYQNIYICFRNREKEEEVVIVDIHRYINNRYYLSNNILFYSISKNKQT